MGAKEGLLLFALLYVQTVIVRAAPDWLPPELLEMVQDDKARCMSEHGTKQEQVEEVDKGIFKNEPSITCYMYCMLEAFSLVDDEADLEKDMMIGLLPESIQERADTVVSKCVPTTGADNCEKIFNLATCVYTGAPDVWFMV
ncbi:general odorant-binding protein 69a-like [Osmia bicornis bicornis]|uniref:general odorant-binding protein 69a-like n=1 Tax=Osmia bicornis bicornis TaxID=1437191 RepID=UPI001EAECEE4|nr:general odorant-binding protein 69a-like [Osmia bicornis bicornis]